MSLELQRIGFWLAIGVGAAFLLYLLSDVLAPFLVGLVLAYIFAPLVDKMEQWHLPRSLGAVLVLFLLVCLLTGLFLLLLPVLFSQFSHMADKVPEYVERLQQWLIAIFPDLLAWANTWPGLLEKEGGLLADKFFSDLLSSLWSGGQAFLGWVSFFIITPIVAAYLLRDWPKIINFVDSLLPSLQAETIRRIVGEIDEALSAFLRGQGMVCLTLALFYGIGLQLWGWDFGLLIGVFSGLISFIPYAGAIVGFGLALQSGLFQFWPDWQWVLMGCGSVFVVGQLLEGYLLTPKFVGEKIGLHVVWIIFALLAFGTLWGFTGLLIALPLSATISVLLRHMLRSYRESNFYQT